jgi:hypothetical protein
MSDYLVRSALLGDLIPVALHVKERDSWRRMSGMCIECGEDVSLPGRTLCLDCLKDLTDRENLKAKRKPPKSVAVSTPRAILPFAVWSLQRGIVREYFEPRHTNFIAEVWNRQDNPIMSKRVRLGGFHDRKNGCVRKTAGSRL